ncbi:MAG: hypothetical protein Ta2D_07440 [Rickettsiales bacterium]|nr:MAG: hypothetical protein Ta2D_07440 [Rickettsiales bacterium]
MFNKVKDFFVKFDKAKIKAKIDIATDMSKNFIDETKNKFNNLYETNLNTGLHFLSKGHIGEANFRFWFMCKTWKEEIVPQYYYAYCLLIKGKVKDSKSILEKIQEQNTDAKILLDKINNGKSDEVVEEYKKNIS